MCDIDQAQIERARAVDRKDDGLEADRRLSGHAQAVRRQRRRRRLIATPITGTRSPPSGPARPARTSTSKSPPATTSTKAARWWRRRASTTAWCRSASQSRSIAAQDAKPSQLLQRGRDRQGLSWPRDSASSGASPSATAGRAGARRASIGTCSCGPAPMRPVQRELASSTTGTGSGTPATAISATRACTRWISRAGDWASARLPKCVVSTGGKYVYDDDQETPNTQLATFDYGDSELVFEVRGLITGGESGIAYDGNKFHRQSLLRQRRVDVLDYARLPDLSRRGSQACPRGQVHGTEEWDTTPHVQNFLKAVRSRNHQDLTCDIEDGYLSAALVHMANISYRTGRSCTSIHRRSVS